MRGGKREGAGRAKGSGAYGEPTVFIRVPKSWIPELTGRLEDLRASVDLRRSEKRPRPPNRIALELPSKSQVTILQPAEAENVLASAAAQGVHASAVILDPWYPEPKKSTRERAIHPLVHLVSLAGQVADHVLVWGWPRHIAALVERVPPPLKYHEWIVWVAKNVPSKERRWRNAQQVCLHLCRPGARTYPEHFLTEDQKSRLRKNRLKYFPGPLNALIVAGLHGAIGKSEQQNHEAQKPVKVFEDILRMTCKPGDLVIDPTAGSGTTGAAAKTLGLRAILSDRRVRSVRTMERRLSIQAQKPRRK